MRRGGESKMRGEGVGNEEGGESKTRGEGVGNEEGR